MQLIAPQLSVESSFFRFMADFEQNDPENSEAYKRARNNFKAYVTSLVDEANGKNLPEGYVPCHHYWMMDDQDNMVGVIRVRHSIDTPFLAQEAGHIGYAIAPAFRKQGYGTMLLKLGLEKARMLGLEKVLITADETNIGSRKVMENNQGQFDSNVVSKVSQCRKSRYWFDLSACDG